MRREEASALAHASSDDPRGEYELQRSLSREETCEGEEKTMVSISYRALDPQSTVYLTLDGLRVQLCIDFLFALSAFLPPSEEIADADTSEKRNAAAGEEQEKEDDLTPNEKSLSSVTLRLQLSDACLTLYADPREERSRALRLAMDVRYGWPS